MYNSLEEAVANLQLNFQPVLRYIMVELEPVVITETVRVRNIDFNFEEFVVGEPLFKAVRVVRDTKGQFHKTTIGYGSFMFIQESRIKELINIDDNLYIYYTGHKHEAAIVPCDFTYMYNSNKSIEIKKDSYLIKGHSGLVTHIGKDNMINAFKFVN